MTPRRSRGRTLFAFRVSWHCDTISLCLARIFSADWQGLMDYEAEKIEIERQKLQLEKFKIRGEARRTIWTSVSVIIPLLAALATVAFGFWSTKEQAKSQFRLEAVKAIMSAPTPAESVDRAELLMGLFPSEMEGFTAQHDWSDRPNAWLIRSQKELFNAIASKEMKPTQILDLWIALFPGDEWAKEPSIRAAATKPPPSIDDSKIDE
jgi:hypothetical protein